jgi:nitrate reductase alpha subunit
MPKRQLPRRTFLGLLGLGGGAAALVASRAWAFNFLEPLRVENPLAAYPSRTWENIYRDLYAYDSTFTFTCAPNDTHNCLLRGYVRGGTLVRIGPTYGYGEAMDAAGAKASHRWDPRCCQKGLALVRRIYGDRRCKYPLVRKGWLDWARAGFPRDAATGKVDAKYLQRGHDPFVRVGWEEAFDLVAQGFTNVAKTWDGEDGKKKLGAQGWYEPEMLDAMGGAGVQTIKMRGGMPLLGVTRIFAQYRFANTLALLDAFVRKVGPDKAVGSRGWDNYTWHTDLPPGHPMVTGQQTVDWDLAMAEHAKLLVVWGMNWITTKMPDAHWLTEARLKGTKVVVIAAEYSATMNKSDIGIVVRPGTTPALALGFAHVILTEKLWDADFVKGNTDLPALVRTDTWERLKVADVKDLKAPDIGVDVIKTGEKPPLAYEQNRSIIMDTNAGKLSPIVGWDVKGKKAIAISREEIGGKWKKKDVDLALEGAFEVVLADGKTVQCKPVFDLLQQYVLDNFDPQTVEQMTWAPAEGIKTVAREIAANKESTLFAMGMGPNQFFNNDLKDRAVFFLASLTRNVGFVGGNVGSYAGNYRAAYFNGLPQWIFEDPFDVELDETKPARPKPRFKYESVHYWNHGDKPLRMGKEMLTGKSHMPVPTKAI